MTQIGAGDLLVLASAFGWAAHVHIVGWLARRSDPIVVASSQFAVCGALSLGVAVFVEPITIRGLHEAWIPIAYAGILSTAGAYTLQVIGQRWVEPAPAGVIMSLETVFAALGGWLIPGSSSPSSRGRSGADRPVRPAASLERDSFDPCFSPVSGVSYSVR